MLPATILWPVANPNDMLLSGTLAGGQALSNRAALLDAPLGKGHVVMFAIRPFWRWQSQGTYGMGFNAFISWTVQIEGTQLGANTNASGTYRIVNVPSGAVTVIGRATRP